MLYRIVNALAKHAVKFSECKNYMKLICQILKKVYKHAAILLHYEIYVREPSHILKSTTALLRTKAYVQMFKCSKSHYSKSKKEGKDQE